MVGPFSYNFNWEAEVSKERTSNNCEAKSPFCLVLVCQLYVDRTRPLIRFNKVIDLLRCCRQGVVEPSCSPIPPFYDASGSESLRLRIGMGCRGLFNRRTHRRKKDAPGFTTSQMHLTCVWDGSRSCAASSTSWHLNISIFMNLRSSHLLYFTTRRNCTKRSSLADTLKGLVKCPHTKWPPVQSGLVENRRSLPGSRGLHAWTADN